VRENKIEKYLHDRVKYLGGSYRRLKYQGRVGATDDLILLPSEGRHLVVECKATDEEPRTSQTREHDRLRAAGFEVHVVSSFEEIDAILPSPKVHP